MIKRSCGTLMHITSLPSQYGIGTLGAEAYRFADFLKDTGQTYWQVLPVNPTGFGNSPYQSFSTYAGNPYLIDLDMLCELGYLEREAYIGLDWGEDAETVDYGKIFAHKFDVLKRAARSAREKEIPGYEAFCEENGWWLRDYAVFMAAKQENDMREWTLWEDEALRRHEQEAVQDFAASHDEELFFWQFTQYIFHTQWDKLKEYVNSLGLMFIGDIPIYVAGDSADVWSARHNFCYDEELGQIWSAGVPPDYFCEDGQLWGNPIYNWEAMREDGYNWWMSRLSFLSRVYDVIRIDHFRGFESYYVVDFGEETARDGRWIKGPGGEFFDMLKSRLGDLHIIAEDLGFLTEEVHEMRRRAGYPGMKILQFAFDDTEASDYLPYKYEYNCVAYTGTHDNTTLMGWVEDTDAHTLEYAREYCALTEEEGYVWGLLRNVYSSVANLCVAQMQDFLELPSAARMNEPSTVGKNWCWRAPADYDRPELIHKIKRMVRLYGRDHL